MRTLTEILNEPEFILVDNQYIMSNNGNMLLNEFKAPSKEPKAPTKQNKHLDHVEDFIIRHGFDGMFKAMTVLHYTHDYLQGKKKDKFNLMMKMDGSPSILWGHDPHTNKFFVGTKAFFNKTPKVNYTDKDIDTNHGTQPVLSHKLKAALKFLKKVSPKKGIFQGDMMYTAEDVHQDDKNNYSFTPNTITYNVNKDSAEGQRMGKAKIGIAPHTYYERDLDGELHARYGVDLSKFTEDSTVHFLNTKLSGKFNYKPAHQAEFARELSKAQALNKTIQRTDGYDIIKQHEPLLIAYINKAVKEKRENSLEGYISFINSQYAKRIDNLKLNKSKDNIRKQLDDEIKNVLDHKSVFKNLFGAHKHIQNAKNVLLKVASEKSPYAETILGNKSKPEGFVASIDHEPAKLVDRQHFSAANFEWNEKVNPDDNPTVLTWGRFNPITKGHERLINTAADIARRTGAKSLTVTTKTHDKNKNPITPSEKLRLLKAMFPGQELAVAGNEDSTLITQLQHLHSRGVKHLTVVAGADRVPSYTKILSRYNGPGDGKLFHFKKIRVISAGDRNSDSDSTEGVSGTKMRDAAKRNDYKSFRKGLPLKTRNPEAQEMFHILRAEMGHIQVDRATPDHSLGILKNHTGEIGRKARAELDRRKKGK